MKLKVLLLALFVAGVTASIALAHGGPGKGRGGDDDHGKRRGKCTEVHLRGTVSPQTLNVLVSKASKKLNLAEGSTVALQLGAAGQTVRVEVEACAVTVGSATQLQVKSLELKAKTPKSSTTTGTTATTTTAPTTTTTP